MSSLHTSPLFTSGVPDLSSSSSVLSRRRGIPASEDTSFLLLSHEKSGQHDATISALQVTAARLVALFWRKPRGARGELCGHHFSTFSGDCPPLSRQLAQRATAN